ncbi:hypothetical protein WKW77_25925 [Variovorax ureilyticus]|uniref:Lipopolysaccharide assembly protein A domain-containing protein n=1 Tax=Variovorax ureilyticus TaxID=1836198 RepID=A0ABU8VLJ9_9BURK
MTTIRIAPLCAASPMYLLSTTARAATSFELGVAESWLIAAVLIAGLVGSILTALVVVWRRKMKTAAEAIAAARERSLKRHTQRMATEFAEPRF